MITENLMGIKRILGSYQKAKKPILINELKLIVDLTKKEKNEKNRLKNRALILIGFSGGFRRSELVDIDYEDLDFVPEGVKIFVKKSKAASSLISAIFRESSEFIHGRSIVGPPKGSNPGHVNVCQ